MPIRLANLGYLALKKETTKGTAVIPDVYVPLYKESLMTKVNLDADNPIAGNKADVFQHIQGMRDHTGELQVLAEPTTAGPILDMLLHQGNASGGSDPYTHPFTLDSTDPKSYTVDIAKGQIVFRFMGVEAHELSPEFSDNKMLFNLSVAARKSFIVREIDTVASDVITFKTNYDPSPTDGLVANDVVRVQKANGSYVDGVVETVDSIIQITTTAALSGIAPGDLIFIKASTPSFSLLTPFLWSRTEFRFHVSNAANALTATHTPMESGSLWKLVHSLANNEGEKRSGSFDPAELARVQGGAELEAKLKFDTADDMNRFLTNQRISCVIRHFSGDDHELRITLNKLKLNENPVELNTSELVYAEGKYKAEYDTDDGQIYDVKLLNAAATI